MSRPKTLFELESLFIEKLTEKYKLNKVDLKRAFILFDKDKSGKLNLNELSSGFKLYLNGIEDAQIQALINCYDVNGDGNISFDEFLGMLLRRDATMQRPSENSSVASSYLGEDINQEFSRQRKPATAIRSTREQELIKSGKAKLYEPVVTRPKSAPRATRATPSQKINSKPTYTEQDNESDLVSLMTASSSASNGRSMSLVSVSDSLVSNMESVFDPTNHDDLENRAKIFIQSLKGSLTRKAQELRKTEKIANKITVSNSTLTSNVGRSLLRREFLKLGGKASDRTDVITFSNFAKALGNFDMPGQQRPRKEVLEFLFQLCSDDEDPSLAIIEMFVEIIFGKAENTLHPQETKKLTSHVDRLGRGPVVDKNSGTNMPLATSDKDVLDRYICSKSRTTLAKPTNFDINSLTVSATPPACNLQREFIYGLRLSELYSGNAIYAATGPLWSQGEHKVIYGASSLGVVHDLSTNTQIFFDGHDDELTCISIDPTCTYVLTGQLGKNPSLYLWEAKTALMVKQVGEGFFSRAVCAACFSYDTRYVCAISCDDRHLMGIWDIHSGNLVVESAAGNGIPPQVRSLSWAPEPQNTSFITSQHSGLNDMIVTCGERNIKMWSFQRPGGRTVTDPNSLLTFKAPTLVTVGKSKPKANAEEGNSSNSAVTQPKIYLCSAFIKATSKKDDLSNANAYNVITGGDNGHLYLWASGKCVETVRAFRDTIVGENVFTGGSDNSVKVFNGQLRLMGEYSTSCNQPTADTGLSNPYRPSTAGSGRSQSAKRATVDRPGSTTAVPRVQRTLTGARDENSISKTVKSDSSQAVTRSRNNVLSICHDTSPFFYNGSGRSVTGTTLVVGTACGECLRVHINSPVERPPTNLFYYHVGSVWALCASGSTGHMFVTGGDDRYLCLWNLNTRLLVARKRMEAAARCCHFDRTHHFLAVGMTRGYMSVFYCDYNEDTSQASNNVMGNVSQPLASTHDSVEDISDIKYSPACNMLAVGSHDNYIYIYSTELHVSRKTSEKSCTLHLLRRLKGHSSYITHLDWSYDGRILRSTCGAYELLYHDVEVGRLFSYTQGWNPSDTKWKSYTCVLGFEVMGIWPLYADGTDINALNVNRDGTLVATADDSGLVNVFNYPCVVKNAPRKSYKGHSSHVLNITFAWNDEKLVTVGGRDNCAISWTVEKTKLGKTLPPDTTWK